MAQETKTATAAQPKTETKDVAKIEKNVSDVVLSRINQMTAGKELSLPPNYSAENALKSAWLILQGVKTREGKPALEACSQTSISMCLLDMVTQGLSPMKKQCYFIPYGTELTLSRSYQGTVALAKRLGGLKEITANVVYQGDEFVFEINTKNGHRQLIKHDQKIENFDNNKIVGAYAVLVMIDDVTKIEVMNIAQIKASWMQGAAKGNSGAHNNFTEEMCKKTVISRACKGLINSSDDSYLADTSSEYNPEEERDTSIQQTANSKPFVEDIQAVSFEEVKEEVKEPVKGSIPF